MFFLIQELCNEKISIMKIISSFNLDKQTNETFSSVILTNKTIRNEIAIGENDCKMQKLLEEN